MFNRNMNLLLLTDYYSTLPIAIVFYYMYTGITNNTLKRNIFISLWIIFSDYISKTIKQQEFPDWFKEYAIRPEGATNSDMLSRNGLNPVNRPGFPSGHMTMTATFVVFELLSRYKTSEGITDFINNNKLFVIFNLIILALMAFTRYYKGVHNWTQIIGGTILGSLMGIILAYFI